MHMQLLPNDKIIIFDRTNFGPSNLSLPQGKCISQAQNSNADCYAHSVEFDPVNRNVRPLTILTDTWCSSGALSPDGVLVQSGGYRLGERVVRTFKPCEDCDWKEDTTGLISPRWYASSQVLPNGKIIVVGGRYEFNYEFVPKMSSSDQTLFQLQFLKETRVVRTYPVMPGGISRNYPSTGSSVLLPIVLQNNNFRKLPDAEVLICGGTLPDSNQKADVGVYASASKSCGRIVITSQNPKWEMEEMPLERVMGDMIMLPTCDVLIINGAAKGTAGWNAAREPVLSPVLYRSNFPSTNSHSTKFEIMSPSTIPRLYHSTAHLLSDGRVLVGGSNPNRNYNFTSIFPTELSLETFSPPYLNSDTPRPTITGIKPGLALSYRQNFRVEFQLNQDETKLGNIYVTMLAPSFTTHSFAMNQRLLVLGLEDSVDRIQVSGAGKYVLGVNAPGTAALAPPGYYQLFVVHEGVPSRAMWVRISSD
ncbi:glyoxal oxidase-related protein [Euphorbia peplus]|nr:glyoxal oxidase-related protein [Euphorbia peplus]